MSEVLEIWNRAPKPDELSKALDSTKSEIILPKGAIIDPLNSAFYGGTRAKPTPIPYSTLRRMAQIPAISAIINTRLNQVARFAKRPRFNGDTGFRITLKDKDKKMTEAQKKRAKEIEDFFLKTGWEKNKVRKDNFNTFLRKITRDSLTLDVVTFEKVNKVKGALSGKMDLAEIWAIDGATIELVINNPTGEGNNYELPVYKPVTKSGLQNIGEIAYVQKINGVVVAEYTEDELAYAIRNPRTDIDYTDFGMSELETLIEIVTGIVNGVRYNTAYFTHSHLPQGVLEIVGKYKDKHLEAFKRHWKILTEGASGKWSVPVLAMEEGQGLKWTPFKNSNRDMEFNQFLEFLFNVACAVYQIDPNEVGFKSWTSGNSMTQSDNTEAKLEDSKDKGFIPLMTFLSDTFNSEIVDLIDEEFVFEWVGLDEEDEDKKLERIEKRLSMGLTTVREERKNEDMEELLDENGQPALWTTAPANNVLMQVFTNQLQAQQQQEQMQMQEKQAEQDRKNQLEDADMQHKRQLEIMDKQHEQNMQAKAMEQLHQRNALHSQHKLNMETKKMEFQHQAKMADKQAQMKQQQEKDKKKQQIKKSIEDDFRKIGIEIDWTDY